MIRGDKVTKGWKIVGRLPSGRLEQLSRRYHSKAAADEAAVLAVKQGYTDVEVRTVQGYDKIK